MGGVGYFLLTGVHVFEGEGVLEVISHHLQTAPERPSSRMGVELPSDLEAIVMACLEKSPEDRPPDARTLLDDLQQCRDAGGWKSKDAERWWRESLADRERRERMKKPDPSPSDLLLTVTVDMKNRGF